ncbi:nuclear transport factor 2 family protein [Sphingorhabdus sp.]|uniref:nuclear transport factor 2 family protein n=1 Tax=Sphingorhabdus sp. TaxID=1902408 RepID=UPI00391A56AC
MPNPAEIWHKVALSRDPATIAAILHDDCVFESPVVHTPQVGKAITAQYLAAAGHTLGNADFAYVGEWHTVRKGEISAILEFQTVIDGVSINGVDMITCDKDGLITHFKVMVRPLKAMNMLHQKMGEMLASMKA